MATQKNTPHKSRKYLVVSGVILVAVVLLGANLLLQHRTSQSNKQKGKGTVAKTVNSVDYSPASSAENSANDDRKSSSSPTDTLTTNPGATNAPLSAKIVSANVNGNSLHIGTLTGGTSTGNCTLTASKAGQNITIATATIQQDVNNYDCGPLNIPLSTFPSTGEWQLTLSVSNDSSQASDSTTINIPGSQ